MIPAPPKVCPLVGLPAVPAPVVPALPAVLVVPDDVPPVVVGFPLASVPPAEAPGVPDDVEFAPESVELPELPVLNSPPPAEEVAPVPGEPGIPLPPLGPVPAKAAPPSGWPKNPMAWGVLF